MRDEEWKVYIDKQPWNMRLKVWLVQRVNSKVFNATIGKYGQIVMTEHKEGAVDPDCLMEVPELVWQKIVDAIADKVPPTKKEAIDAELLATKFHLEDMRRLVFKNK